VKAGKAVRRLTTVTGELGLNALVQNTVKSTFHTGLIIYVTCARAALKEDVCGCH